MTLAQGGPRDTGLEMARLSLQEYMRTVLRNLLAADTKTKNIGGPRVAQ